MPTAQNDLLCYKGEAVKFTFTQKPVEDISTWTIVLTVKGKPTDAVAKISQPATIDNGPAGQYSITLSTGQTNIAAGAFVYDIWRTNAGSEAILSIGAFILQQDVRL